MKSIQLPVDEKTVRSLKAGDVVSLSGVIVTGRDAFHKHFSDGGSIPKEFKDGALYHCGPVVIRDGEGWKVVAAGPTTSVRENVYEPKFIAASGVRLIIGKGGMDEATHAALVKHGAVYLQAVGGAAALAAATVKKVEKVDFLDEFGAAEACWHLRVENFTAVVAMDASGKSLFTQVREKSKKVLMKLLKGKTK